MLVTVKNIANFMHF